MFLWSCCHSTGKRTRENACERAHNMHHHLCESMVLTNKHLIYPQSFDDHTAQGNFGCKWQVLTWTFTASFTNTHTGTQVPSTAWHNMTTLTSEGDFWRVLGMWGETSGRDTRDTSSILSSHLLPVSYHQWALKMDSTIGRKGCFREASDSCLIPMCQKVVNIVKPLTLLKLLQ